MLYFLKFFLIWVVNFCVGFRIRVCGMCVWVWFFFRSVSIGKVKFVVLLVFVWVILRMFCCFSIWGIVFVWMVVGFL